jgi:transposase-like protein
MYDSHPTGAVTRPSACPYCNGNRLDTLAKVVTPATCWRCRECDRTWTIATAPAPPADRR